ncbi:MAG: hypothetical protein RL375_3404 [Pseudomonadota bacterium]|jgi:hypothetical protein
MNGLLYRAVACVHGRPDPEVHVFFEAPPLTNPGNELLTMLSAVWYAQPGSIDITNVVSEHEHLARWAVGHQTTGDARLLETGFGPGGVHYCDPNHTLLLVSPPVMQRLLQAQKRVRMLQAADAWDEAAKRQAVPA